MSTQINLRKLKKMNFLLREDKYVYLKNIIHQQIPNEQLLLEKLLIAFEPIYDEVEINTYLERLQDSLRYCTRLQVDMAAIKAFFKYQHKALKDLSEFEKDKAASRIICPEIYNFQEQQQTEFKNSLNAQQQLVETYNRERMEQETIESVYKAHISTNHVAKSKLEQLYLSTIHSPEDIIGLSPNCKTQLSQLQLFDKDKFADIFNRTNKKIIM
ncbi:Hypothetical_protein [Hexamita inflata]|uniref:Hypothetical_protein n=1 Tax=Hexamita inflata TaxID=28002 RepID=A0ABP1HVG3_9EUKA